MTAPRPALVYTELAKLVGEYDRDGVFRPGSLRPHDPKTCGQRVGATDQVVWCLACEYQWTFNAAHDRTVGETNGSRGAIAFSDPAGSIVVGPVPEDDGWSPEAESMMNRPNPKDKARARCSKAFADLRRIINSVDAVDQVLRSAMRDVDGHHGPQERIPDDTEENRKRLITGAEHSALENAAARRRSRGEGFGEG